MELSSGRFLVEHIEATENFTRSLEQISIENFESVALKVCTDGGCGKGRSRTAEFHVENRYHIILYINISL